ncbi:MAG TPA: sulfatase-like hydrolase/transferase, partial [Longimicrobiales bacterium]|nr:sulfatase-like hydrolase/transferase [Longimicrobiales bacterium]
MRSARWNRMVVAAVSSVTLAACSEPSADASPLTVAMPLHLERHLETATLVGSEVPADAAEAGDAMEWQLDRPQSDWQPAIPWSPTIDPVELTQRDDALRVTLTEGTSNPNGVPRGGIVLQVPELDYDDLAYLVVRARTTDFVQRFSVNFNRREGAGAAGDFPLPYEHVGSVTPVVSDGTVQTYRVRLDFFGGNPPPDDPIRQIALWFGSNGEPASIDILSITLIPKAADYAEAGAADRTEVRGRVYRQSIYMHAPGRLEYTVRVPEGGRFDFGMGVVREDPPVTFRVTVDGESVRSGASAAAFEELYANKEAWGQRSVSLADFAGQTVTLGLAVAAEEPGTVGLWGAPTVTGRVPPSPPNVVFYVFDGGAADFMSVYGYNRRTTPTLERLAAEGVVFERAYSNSSWTLPSTASFMTSLHTSVTGGLPGGSNPVPAEAVTMAEHMHTAGYQTAAFTGNPNAGTLSNLQRGVDVFREDWEDFSYFGGNNHRESSTFLHEGFWEWREAYPSQPFWAHFQTTDTHEDFPTVAPFAGRFVSPVERETWR